MEVFKQIFDWFTAWKVSVFGVFLVLIFRILLSKSSYSVQMGENKDQKNSKYRHFLRSGCEEIRGRQ